MRKLALVRLSKDWKDESVSPRSIFKDAFYYYLGEIPNMLGHGIFIGRDTGKIHAGFHTERFEEVPEDEV